jgi:hypothetical protein
MPVLQSASRDGVALFCLESDWLRVLVAPSVGGRIVSILDQRSGYEFLWQNRALRLERLPAGSAYDPNFYGGIDELLPNDLPESWDSLTGLDHGELWTTTLNCRVDGHRLTLGALLPGCGLAYERVMHLRPDQPCLDFHYRIRNTTAERRRFLWKLHAALAIQRGDFIDCPARYGQVVDPAWSRFKTTAPFPWPELEGTTANLIPAANGTMDFFYLFNLRAGQIAWRRPGVELALAYRFETRIFSYCWLFASYGGFEGHYTVILEPCTTMPLSVRDAAALNQCSVLEPGTVLETKVELWAGRSADFSPPLEQY